MKTQPWIGKPWFDAVFILLPPFLSLAVIAAFPAWFQNNKELPVAGWVILILLIDVAQVYSTLYRTYFDPQALRHQRSLLWTIPFLSFVAGVLLYSLGAQWFWRVLAYVAIFHFVRQQYGFLRVYTRKEPKTEFSSLLDSLTIYGATLYPLLHWHLGDARNFNWFVEGDFLRIPSAALLSLATVVYVALLVLYTAKEAWRWWTTKRFNFPKNAVVLGTALSWYFGIVYFNGDMAFTLLNVVSHGVPYMALVWLHGKRAYRRPGAGSRFLRTVFSTYGWALFVGSIFLLAFVEEGLWDLAVWKEHGQVFGTGGVPDLRLDKTVLSFVVPLLAVPQLTHYILDGFIWKIRDDGFRWSNEQKTVNSKPPLVATANTA